MNNTQKIPLSVGQRFVVADIKHAGYVFTVRKVIENGSNPLFTADADDAKKGRLEHMVWTWPQCALIHHAKRGELRIAKI